MICCLEEIWKEDYYSYQTHHSPALAGESLVGRVMTMCGRKMKGKGSWQHLETLSTSPVSRWRAVGGLYNQHITTDCLSDQNGVLEMFLEVVCYGTKSGGRTVTVVLQDRQLTG